eukprot:CAMPEP_0171155464 /NCGR_PEP_ID=MMETSP0790-20130122/913_1 /TAXON_ID=2925 /ORGANISM="Alexandrium catenella, Strain OF101" /LENGTH=57 /DNA_ID=CAMNT_0011619683 /DNA_START=72 /DNA_END=245 /DNA_ORIENTATION=+
MAPQRADASEVSCMRPWGEGLGCCEPAGTTPCKSWACTQAGSGRNEAPALEGSSAKD